MIIHLDIDRELREIAALGLAKDGPTIDALYASLQAIAEHDAAAAADPMRGPVLSMMLAFIEFRSASNAYLKSRADAIAEANQQPLTDDDF